MSTLQHLQDLEMADALVVVGAVDGVAGVDGHLLDAAPVAAAPALVVRARRRPRPDQSPPSSHLASDCCCILILSLIQHHPHFKQN